MALDTEAMQRLAFFCSRRHVGGEISTLITSNAFSRASHSEAATGERGNEFALALKASQAKRIQKKNFGLSESRRSLASSCHG